MTQETMVPTSNHRPVIVFGKMATERDHWRAVLIRKGMRVLCFESETTCFDNLISIHPTAIVLSTDSSALVWRFIFALHASRIDTHLLVVSNALTGARFQPSDLIHPILCLPATLEAIHQLDIPGTVYNTSCRPGNDAPGEILVGKTAAIANIKAALPGLAHNTDPILITGECGTGKEHLARMIAKQVDSESAFIKLDCAQCGTPNAKHAEPGHHAAADSGWWPSLTGMLDRQEAWVTLLLHQIHCLDDDGQSKMLLLLDRDQTARHIRFIATSEVAPTELVERRRFRKDLFYRLNVIPFHLPPLKDRKTDLTRLMDFFIISECAQRKTSFVLPSTQVADRLSTYHWPGNLDELRNAMQRLVIAGDEERFLAQKGLPWAQNSVHDTMAATLEMEASLDMGEIQGYKAALGRMPLKSICDHYVQRTEKKIMQKALEYTNWNRKRAAVLLNISYKSMLNKMKNYEIV